MMPDLAAKAKWVLETKGITDTPARALHDIAKSEKIHIRMEAFPEEPNFSGELLFKGDKRAIIINTHIQSSRRHTFTFAHELGHYFLQHAPTYEQDDAAGIFCTNESIKTEVNKQEREANAFAVELLMPESRFRLSMAGAPFDFPLITGLAHNYQVSKQACGYRVLEFTQSPCVIIHSKNGRITMQRASRAARGFLRQMTHIPQATAACTAIQQKCGQTDFSECDPAQWLARYSPVTQLYECTRGRFENGVAMTLLRW